MRQLHGEKFGDAEMLHFKQTIRASCIEHFINILSDVLEYKPLLAKDRDKCTLLLEQYKEKPNIDRNFLDSAVKMWQIRTVQEYISEITSLDSFSASINDEGLPEDVDSKVSRAKSVQKLHSDNPANHFLRYFDKILAEGYTPRLEDILNLRIATTGNTQMAFVVIGFHAGNILIAIMSYLKQFSLKLNYFL